MIFLANRTTLAVLFGDDTFARVYSWANFSRAFHRLVLKKVINVLMDFFVIHIVYDLYRELVKFIPFYGPVSILGLSKISLKKLGFGEIFARSIQV